MFWCTTVTSSHPLNDSLPRPVRRAMKKLNFPLLSDFNKSVSSDYGVLYEEFIGYNGVSKRSAFVVSKEGTISYAWSSDDPKQLPDFDSIKAAIL